MFVMGAIMRLSCDLLMMVSPQIMKKMITHVTKMEFNDQLAHGDKVYEWQGYFYAVLMLGKDQFVCHTIRLHNWPLISAVLTIITIVQAQYYERMFLVALNLRTALISVIYKKSLTMSASAKKVSTVGEAVNIMSVDVQRFMDLLPYINMVW